MNRKLTILSLVLAFAATVCAQGMKETDPAFFTTAEAQRIGDQMLIYQRVTGGWPKNIDMAKPMSEAEKAQVKSRIILAPEHAKRLLMALQDNVKKYEQQFGTIRLQQAQQQDERTIAPFTIKQGEA